MGKYLSSGSLSAASVSRHTLLVGIVFLSVMGAGLWQFVAVVVNPSQLEFPLTWLDFREGRSTGALEKQIDKNLPARSTLIAAANSVRYLLTRGGGDQVLVGQAGWLFLTDEVRFDRDGSAHLNIRTQLFADAARSLDQRGVKLVIALVPDKARLYAGYLPSGLYPTYNLSRYENALVSLQQHNVTVVDLLTPLTAAASQAEVYYRSDSHWNQVGAQVSANAVAIAVRKLGVKLEKTVFDTAESGDKTKRAGDLIRLMGLGDTPNALRPPLDIELPLATRQTSIEAASGLFGDSVVPVALTGTSYSLRGNFHGFLQQSLSAKVLNTAKDGGGLLQAATAYLSNDAFKLNKPKILIWEVPERFLYTKLDDESKWINEVGFLP